jgi:hypothetical protein
MRKIFFVIFINIFFQCLQIAEARKIFINEAVLATSNNPNHGFEVALFITNPTNSPQTVKLQNSLYLRSYNINGNSFTYKSKTFYIARNLGAPKDTAGAIGVSSATSMPSDLYPASTESITIAANSTLQILFATLNKCLLDSSNPAGCSMPSDLGISNLYTNLVGGVNSAALNSGTYFAQIIFTGFINIIDDAHSQPGFLIGSGSILYPHQSGGLESASAWDFQINNGKAF